VTVPSRRCLCSERSCQSPSSSFSPALASGWECRREVLSSRCGSRGRGQSRDGHGGCNYASREAASAKPRCLLLLLASSSFTTGGKRDVNLLSQILEKSLLRTGYSPVQKQKLETIFSVLISEVSIFKYLVDLHSWKGVSIHL